MNVFKENKSIYNRPTCNTKEVKKAFENSFKEYYKEIDDLPVNICLSCHGLKKRKSCIDLSLAKTIKFDHLRHLLDCKNFNTDNLNFKNMSKVSDLPVDTFFMCSTCAIYFRKNVPELPYFLFVSP